MLDLIQSTCNTFPERTAFVIKDTIYTYREFSQLTARIHGEIGRYAKTGPLIGVVTDDDINTYASIFAVLFTGCGFVPLNPRNPVERNLDIIKQTDIRLILGSEPKHEIFRSHFVKQHSVLFTNGLQGEDTSLVAPEITGDTIQCILFTSGSTGAPKGVPMTVDNIDATVDAFFSLGYDLDETDRFLQMFEFSFDMSLLSYIMPLCIGASVYHVSEAEIKYLSAIRVMQQYNVTFAAMVPSTLSFLRPYFKKFQLERLRYSQLGGEPFYIDLAMEWAQCIPNAQIVNISGPTETTMACMGYNLSSDPSKNKAYRGVLAFGRPWKNTTAIVVDEQLRPLLTDQQGELCFAGKNVMKGYWKRPEKNKQIFFRQTIDGQEQIFYRSGDMAFVDQDGDFFSCGRVDHQHKIQGYKVELGDIEQHARDFANGANVAAIVFLNTLGMLEIHLFVEHKEDISDEVAAYLKTRLPVYMIPKEVTTLPLFPINLSGKIDRQQLKKMAHSE